MRPYAFFALCLTASACNGALPPAPETTGAASSGAAAGSGTGREASSTGAAATGSTGGSITGSAAGSATGSGASSSAGGTTGQPATGGTTGGTSAGIGTSSGAGSSTGGTTSGTGTGGTTGGSACNPACAAKLTCCGTTCVDLTGDTFNCGQCGKQCAESDYCSDSNCVAACTNTVCTGGSCCGGQCCDANAVCCLDNGLVARFVCEDPDAGSCPIGCAPMCVSRRDAKRDIQYLDDAQLQSAEQQVMKIPLARFNYKWDAPGERRRLGFIIEDVAPNPGIIDEARGEVDLYGYASLAVAAVQEQAKEIERLRQQVDELEKQLRTRKTRRTR